MIFLARTSLDAHTIASNKTTRKASRNRWKVCPISAVPLKLTKIFSNWTQQIPRRRNTNCLKSTRHTFLVKTYVLGQLPQFEHGPEDLREHLDREGWPTAWESLQKIEACKDGLNWTWGEADNHLLYKLTKRWEISSKVMAGFFFIGMRPKQCEIQFKKIEDEYDARYEVGSGHFAQRQE